MLGKSVTVTIDSPEPQREKRKDFLYKGYLESEQPGGKKAVYVMGAEPVEKSFFGTVIAVLNKGQAEEKLIVAPAGKIFYEPDIRAGVTRAAGQRPLKISCLYEKSCGAVVFQRSGGVLRYLLVKNKNGRHWGFPKGHVEAGENERDTALREVREETGLDVTLLDGFRERSEYCPFGKVRKQVIFFLAESREGRVVIQEEEIDRFRWATYEEAVGLFCYDNDRRVLGAARQWLSGHRF